MKLACGEKVCDKFYSGQCRERVETVLKNLCLVSNDDEKAAGELLFAVRFKKGMTQSEIARLECVSRQAVSKRIKKSIFCSRTQKVMKKQIKEQREHRKKLIYEQYMDGVMCLQISRKFGDHNPCHTAKEYAKKHHLPFISRMDKKKKSLLKNKTKQARNK